MPPAERQKTPTDAAEPASAKLATTGRRDTPSSTSAAAVKPDVVVTVSKSASSAHREGRRRQDPPLRSGHHRQRARSAADRRLEGQRRRSTTRSSTTTRTCSGMPTLRTRRPRSRRGPTIRWAWSGSTSPRSTTASTGRPSRDDRQDDSHGCVRLTNWDAPELAGLVKPGTPVIFTE